MFTMLGKECVARVVPHEEVVETGDNGAIEPVVAACVDGGGGEVCREMNSQMLVGMKSWMPELML